MKTLKELSHDSFYNMENYSQIVIDLIQEVEQAFREEEERREQYLWEVLYDVDNLLEVINKKRTHDYNALVLLSSLINKEIKTFKSE
jgi:hypothetical protein